MAGGVDSSPREQFLWCEKLQPCLDFCPVYEGPVGALSPYLPAAGAPAQTLPHCLRIRLALRFHTTTAAAAAGWPKVQEHTLTLSSEFKFYILLDKTLLRPACSLVVLQQSSECKKDQHSEFKWQLHLSLAELLDSVSGCGQAEHHVTRSPQSFHTWDHGNYTWWERYLRQQS